MAQGRARSFAFIFYNFRDEAIRKILKDQGVFAELDRLSGNRLSIFYLHNGSKASVEAFNKHFVGALGIKEEVILPCVVFFRADKGKIVDVTIAELDNADLIHGFRELYGVVEEFLAGKPPGDTTPSRAIRWVKASVKFLTVEVFRAALKKGIELLYS